jgi:PAS domain S-box-containing protein
VFLYDCHHQPANGNFPRSQATRMTTPTESIGSIPKPLRRSEEDLHKQSDWLRVTLASIGDAVLCTDAQGRITFMNTVAETLTGWPLAEALGRPLTEVFRIVNEFTGEPAENPALLALRDGAIAGLANHTILIARDGTARPIDDSAAPMRDEAGAMLGTVLVFRDVSERRRAEEDRARLAAIVASSDDAIISKTLDGVIRSWNAGAERLFGYTAQEAVGRPITLIIPPERHDEERVILEKLRRGERIDHFETVRVGKDGRPLDISLTVSPVRDDAGHVIGASKVARDVTDKKRAEEALRVSRARLDYAVRLSGVGYWHCDLPFDVLGWDERVKEHFWLPPDARVTIQTFYERLHPDDREPARQAIEASIRDRVSYDVTYRTTDPAGGALKWVRALGGTSYAADGTPTRFDGVTLDVTAQKLNEIRLAEALDRERAQGLLLREQDRRKDEFLALLAHELRNPLAPLRNGLQVIRLAGTDANTVAQARGMMERQLGHMVRLIDDLLDISRVNRNKMELRRTRVPLADAVSSAVEAARPLLDAGGHALTVALPPEPVFLDADLTRLAQVFGNLLTNSAKYTPRGGHVWLTAERRGEEVIVSVRDDGIGIPAGSLRSIFDMFSQVDRSIERATGGLGIGLALVKGLVEMHGGTVTAESPGVGKGSTFTVRLPVLADRARPTPEGGTDEVAHAAGPKRRILVVDDSKDSATSMAMMLRLMNNEVRTAHDGVEAVTIAEAFRPQVILMDVGMPRLNGLDATRRIRERPWGRSPVIIALTGWGQEGDKERTREAGCDGHLVKPVNPPELEKLLAELAGRGS